MRQVDVSNEICSDAYPETITTPLLISKIVLHIDHISKDLIQYQDLYIDNHKISLFYHITVTCISPCACYTFLMLWNVSQLTRSPGAANESFPIQHGRSIINQGSPKHDSEMNGEVYPQIWDASHAVD